MDDATLAIVLALGALMVGAIADLLYRVGQTRGIDTGVFLFWQSAVFSAGIWVGALATGQIDDIIASTWVWGLPSGLLSYVGLYLFVFSLRTGDASVNAFQVELGKVCDKTIEIDIANKRNFKFADMKTHASLCLAALPILLCARWGTMQISIASGRTPILISIEPLQSER